MPTVATRLRVRVLGARLSSRGKKKKERTVITSTKKLPTNIILDYNTWYYFYRIEVQTEYVAKKKIII